ncbi:hypothetical protein G6F46_001214 [Rhizopus delemar]|uniref:Uncharacterized protein n=2 Tax=Rhizopus TaxID=4842 RepID=A0A9P6ZDI7_9FUNG|nr:hypothetical protein G6F36_013501 [Rhizopus arrhizus]KAG1450000.1 hypothetical protein G6F55_009902 [Rhizopus delemar]KAG1499115.1 hypothetical protein G6F54_004623 [Rhizopus delemar]KAG1510484.1 hypothetical protein G6F53_006652 [Rhizopus delemar]KAG1520228.1 hypothetical protein G6F52_007864 [Rhizopus delemar]
MLRPVNFNKAANRVRWLTTFWFWGIKVNLIGAIGFALMKDVYIKKLNRESPPATEQDNMNIANGFNSNEIQAKLDDIFSRKDDIDEMLSYIQGEKMNLIKNKKRKSELYALLSITEKVIEDMEYWSKDENEQEMTFYRRFASLLDVLFGASEIRMADGDTACSSSRVCTETNKRLFNVDDPTPAYSRKIDLLLKYDENISVELCSNEWKKLKVSHDLMIKQQSKNL